MALGCLSSSGGRPWPGRLSSRLIALGPRQRLAGGRYSKSPFDYQRRQVGGRAATPSALLCTALSVTLPNFQLHPPTQEIPVGSDSTCWRGAPIRTLQFSPAVGREKPGLPSRTAWVVRKLSRQGSTGPPWGGPTFDRRKTAAALRRRGRFRPGTGPRAGSPGVADRGSPRGGRSRRP
jgi:hypothetical protein